MRTAAKAILLFFTVVIIFGNRLSAQNTKINTTIDKQERRTALVIGNSDYLQSPLINPVNDARSMARALRNAGFDVILAENLSNKDDMKRKIRDFGFKLEKGGVGLFYYAGHGVQVDGFNFLVPVNAVINNEAEVEYEAVDAGFVVAQMEAAQNRLNIIILDACRNNPYARSMRSTQQGLTTMNAPTGSIIAYATAPGSIAIDGSGANGLYTQELLVQIEKQDIKIEDAFKNVRGEVVKKSQGQQTPWESSSLIGDFYFHPKNVVFASVETPAEELATVNYNTAPKAEWKATGNTYWLYVNGVDISKETKAELKGNDLYVTHSVSGARFLLSDFKAATSRDGKLRPAKILDQMALPKVGRSTAPAMDRINKSAGDPLATINKTSRPKQYKPKEKVRMVWRATRDGEYFLLINGIDISKQCKHKLVGKDLYVYHATSGRIFLLKNFAFSRDYQPRKALLVK